MRLARAQGCGAVKFFVPKHADLGYRFDALTISMTTERELREKLRKISALFEGATTIGERHAAAAAIDRVRKALAVAARTEQLLENAIHAPRSMEQAPVHRAVSALWS